MKEILIKIIVLFHKLLVYFMLFGFVLPKKYLYLHIMTWPIVYLHWQINNDKCFLTELEYKLKGIPYKSVPNSSNDHDYPFMRRIFGDIGLNLTNEQIHSFILKYLTLAWAISLIRILQ